jgi:predicted nucleotidyltransferase
MKNITSYKFLQQLTALPYVEEIWLYGSRARGDNQDRSDIDLAIICPQATREEWLKIVDIIDEADTLLKIDCVRFDTLKDTTPFKDNIFKDKKVLYSKENKNE